MAIGAAVAASAALSAGAKHDVLALNRPVPAGRTITAADLRTVRVAADPSIPTVPASEEQSVVGDITAVDLVANSLLSPAIIRRRNLTNRESRRCWEWRSRPANYLPGL